MHRVHFFACAAAALGVLWLGTESGLASGGKDRIAAEAAAGNAVREGLRFLEKDAARWKAERQCATCHHGTLTLWAFNEAKRAHYAVPPEALAEMEQGTRERFLGSLDKPRDPRPGWNMINTPALYLAVMAQSQPALPSPTVEERRRIAGHATRHLEEDGSVLTPATMSPPRPIDGPPPVFESREILTLLGALALRPQKPLAAEEPAAVHEARKKVGTWLALTAPGDDTQAQVLRLLLAARERKPGSVLRAATEGLLARRNPDGGWGQLRRLPSDAYATGQVLYGLSLAGVDHCRPEIGQAVAFLVGNQRADGSWPMTSRAHPGATPYTNPVPITYFGSCWAVMGLARSAPARPAN